MKYAIVVHGAPYDNQSSHSAWHFAQALLACGHEISRVFFYHAGVQNASALSAPPQDEVDWPGRWQQLHDQHQVDLVACVAASQRRGMLDTREAERLNKLGSNTLPGFRLSGLGQLIDACVGSDRTVVFPA